MTESAPYARFVAAIQAGDDEATEAAALALAPADAEALRALACEGTGEQRWWAVRTLAAVGDAAALPPLRAALEAADPALRAAAALAVGHLGRRHPDAVEAALPALVPLLEDDDGLVRQAAADGLALCGDAAVPLLAAVALGAGHSGARARATGALCRIRTHNAAAVLFRLLNDPNPLVHAYAYKGLDAMGLLDNLLLKP